MSQLKTQVDDALKSAFVKLALSRNLSEAALLRELVIGATLSEVTRPSVSPEANRKTKSITVYVPAFLKEHVAHRARSRCLTTSGWVSALIQSNLMQDPVMTHNQLAALNASIRELSAIGRNVNQIAKALNQRPGDTGLSVEILDSISAKIGTHRSSVRELVRASERSWSA
jgi:hypothetical protein